MDMVLGLGCVHICEIYTHVSLVTGFSFQDYIGQPCEVLHFSDESDIGYHFRLFINDKPLLLAYILFSLSHWSDRGMSGKAMAYDPGVYTWHA